MAAPRKPWEGGPANFNNAPSTFDLQGNGLIGAAGMAGIQNARSNVIPPPLPPRPTINQNPFTTSRFGYQPMMNSYHSPYSSHSSYMSPYGGFGTGYGHSYGMQYGGTNPYGAESSIMRIAEDSSRSAFQSVESVVHTFGSISMMLESTLNALYSSFRAVVGVVDHFGRLKSNLSQVLSFLAIIRSLRWIFAKLLYLVGARKVDPSVERAWISAVNLDPSQSEPGNSKVKRPTNWPIVAFFAVVLGTPWLIWKLMCNVAGVEENEQKWATGEGEHYVAVAAYDFTGESDKEISFKAQQQIRLAPKELQPRVRGWLLGSVDGKKTGLLPANYVKIMHKKEKVPEDRENIGVQNSPETSASVDDAFLNTAE